VDRRCIKLRLEQEHRLYSSNAAKDRCKDNNNCVMFHIILPSYIYVHCDADHFKYMFDDKNDQYIDNIGCVGSVTRGSQVESFA